LHPIAMSILGGPGEVSVHQVPSSFPSLPSLKELAFPPGGNAARRSREANLLR
jgi:hypothetical protein